MILYYIILYLLLIILYYYIYCRGLKSLIRTNIFPWLSQLSLDIRTFWLRLRCSWALTSMEQPIREPLSTALLMMLKSWVELFSAHTSLSLHRWNPQTPQTCCLQIEPHSSRSTCHIHNSKLITQSSDSSWSGDYLWKPSYFAYAFSTRALQNSAPSAEWTKSSFPSLTGSRSSITTSTQSPNCQN